MHGIMAAAGRIERVLLKDAIHDVFSIFINMYISHNSSIHLLTLLSFIIILFNRAKYSRWWRRVAFVWVSWGWARERSTSQCGGEHSNVLHAELVFSGEIE